MSNKPTTQQMLEFLRENFLALGVFKATTLEAHPAGPGKEVLVIGTVGSRTIEEHSERALVEAHCRHRWISWTPSKRPLDCSDCGIKKNPRGWNTQLQTKPTSTREKGFKCNI
jgi:hypothetical protein